MTTKKNDQLTPLELEVMDVLWEVSPANVQTVQAGLKRELAYTTVQTILNILHRKKRVERKLRERAYFYQPLVSRGQIAKKSVGDIIERLFGGSVEDLLMNMVETKQLTPEILARLQATVSEDEEKSDGNG